MILPNKIAVSRVNSLNFIVGVGEEHDAVPDQWCALVTALMHGDRPTQAKLLNIGPINRLQRTVSVTVRCPSPVKPISLRWVVYIVSRNWIKVLNDARFKLARISGHVHDSIGSRKFDGFGFCMTINGRQIF